MTVRIGALYPQRQGALSGQPYSFRNGGWADLATALGMGILSADGQNVSLPQGIAIGLQNFQQMADRRKQDERQAWLDEMTQQQFDLTKSEAELRAEDRKAERDRKQRVRDLLKGGSPIPMDQGGPAAGQFMISRPGVAGQLGLPEALSAALAEEGDPTVFASLFGRKADRDAQAERDAASMAWDREKFDKQYALDRAQLGQSAANAAAARRIQETELALKLRDASGPFQGTSMEAQDTNILLGGDPASAAYKAAYNRQAQEKIQVAADGTVVRVKPDMSAFRVPTFTGAMSDGLAPSGLPTSNAYGPPAQVNREVGQSGTPAEREKIRAAQAEVDKLASALLNYGKAYKNASAAQKAGANVGASNELTSAYNNAALLAKGDALYALGVLNGVDLERLQQSLADPTTMMGALAGSDTVNKQIDEMLKLVETGINSRRQAIGMEPIKLPRAAQNGDGTRPSAGSDFSTMSIDQLNAIDAGALPPDQARKLSEEYARRGY